MKKIGLSKTMPKGEARPLGTKKKKGSASAAKLSIVKRAAKEAIAQHPEQASEVNEAHESAGIAVVDAAVFDMNKPLDTPNVSEIDSPQPPIPVPNSAGAQTMTLTLKSLNKRGTQAIYVGARTAIRFSTSNFTDKIAPEYLEVEGVLGPKAPKVKLTKAERAALPKLTLAEKIARREAALDKLRKQAQAVSM